MRAPRVLTVLLAALLASLAGRPATAQEQAAPSPAAADTAGARITYIAGGSVYIDAGRAEGLREGTVVEVTRDGRSIATLAVAYLSEHRASCTIASATEPPAVGDEVRYVFRKPAAGGDTGETAAGRPSPAARGRFGGPGLHGRAGVRYLVLRDGGGAQDNGFTQPSLDLRLDGDGLGGSDFDLHVDVRARQTYRNWSGSEDQRLSRVYRLDSTYHLPDTRQRITVGRQFAPSLEAVSLFDGVLYESNGDRWGAGFLAGTQPDPADLGFDGTVREYGGYLVLRSLPPESRQWAVTLGLIDSYAEGDVNREWLYLQGRYRGPRLSGFLSQEIDYNRSWKTSQAGESTFSPTSTFASLHVRATDRITFQAGYDNRRSVRLWLDRITPATVFDDTHRQGAWAGASFQIGDHLRIGGDGRVSTGGPSGRADGFSASLGWDGLGAVNAGFSLRETRYGNERSDGWLHTVTGGFDLGRFARMDLSAGRVEETDQDSPELDRSDDWFGLDLEVVLVRRWFLSLSGERYTGTFQDQDQMYAAITYRF